MSATSRSITLNVLADLYYQLDNVDLPTSDNEPVEFCSDTGDVDIRYERPYWDATIEITAAKIQICDAIRRIVS